MLTYKLAMDLSCYLLLLNNLLFPITQYLQKPSIILLTSVRNVKHSTKKKNAATSNNYTTIKRRKVNWIFNILLRNCLIKHVTEGQEDEEEHVSRY